MGLQNCHNFQDIRALAKRRLPGPIVNNVACGTDDEVMQRAKVERDTQFMGMTKVSDLSRFHFRFHNT